MTRINVIHPSDLSDAHLTAEYKEITRPFNKVLNAIAKGRKLCHYEISDKYVLGRGHETFFFNKLCWLHRRYYALYAEMGRRGFNADRKKYLDTSMSLEMQLHRTEFWGEYVPTDEDKYVNMARLVVRSKNADCAAEIERAMKSEEM